MPCSYVETIETTHHFYLNVIYIMEIFVLVKLNQLYQMNSLVSHMNSLISQMNNLVSQMNNVVSQMNSLLL